jgi:hypothetical protein
VRKILAGVALGDFDMALTRQRFKADVQVTHAMTTVFIIVALYSTGFSQQATAAFILR